jgi:hypothetical protein
MKLIANTDDIEHLNQLIKRYGLGPTTAVGVIAGSDMVLVELDGTIAHRSVLLARWLNVLDVHSMVAGKIDAADPLLRLHLRGSLPGWPTACVTMPYREAEDAAHCATIRDLIEQQAVTELIDKLSVVDGVAWNEFPKAVTSRQVPGRAAASDMDSRSTPAARP